MPRVSIICTVKNGRATLSSAIESVLQQSYGDWEFLIIDDGSSDDTGAVVQRYLESDKRCRFVSTPGIGRGAALNLAVESSCGEYIANIDADDHMHPQRLALQLEAFRRYPRYTALSTGTVFVREEQPPRWRKYSPDEVSVVDITRALMVHNPINHSSVMLRASHLRQAGGYSTDRRSQFDYDLWVKLAEQGRCLGRIPLCLASSRFHRRQAFQRRRHFRYRIESSKIQYRAIRAMHGLPYAYFFPIARFLYGTVPERVRVAIAQYYARASFVAKRT